MREMRWHALCFSHGMATKPTSQETTTPATIDQILLAAVDAILQQQDGTKRWGAREHASMVKRLALGMGMPAERASEFFSLLIEHGAGSNASQFRQWLETPVDDKGPGRLQPGKKRLADYA